jgi:hypothetical protein
MRSQKSASPDFLWSVVLTAPGHDGRLDLGNWGTLLVPPDFKFWQATTVNPSPKNLPRLRQGYGGLIDNVCPPKLQRRRVAALEDFSTLPQGEGGASLFLGIL